MENVNYERVAHLLAIAKGIDLHREICGGDGLCIQFSNYVKSQIHLNFVSGFFDRNIYSYKKVYDYLYGRCTLPIEATQEVLCYFYNDVANCCINYNKPLKLIIDIDTDVGLPDLVISYNKELARFKEFYYGDCESFDMAMNIVKLYHDYMQFFSKVQSRYSEDLSAPYVGNYMLAAILLQNVDKKVIFV